MKIFDWLDDYFSANELVTIARLRKDIRQKNTEIKNLIAKNANQLIDLQNTRDKLAYSDVIERELRTELRKLKETKLEFDTVSMIQPLYKKSDLKPTQSNKPSSASSLEYEPTVKRLKQIFPYPKYKMTRVANTNSMEPFIDANSLIIYEKLTASVLKKQPLMKGDICIYKGVYRGYSTMFIHRIVDIDVRNNRYKFKGDNNFSDDGWIERDRITHRYIGQIQTKREVNND